MKTFTRLLTTTCFTIASLLALTGTQRAQAQSFAGLVRYQLTGAYDTNFELDGVSLTDIAGSGDEGFQAVLPTAVTIGNDRYVAVGYRSAPGSSNRQIIVQRFFSANGAVDTSFGTNGRTETNLSQFTSEFAADVALDSMRRIVVAVSAQGTGAAFSAVVARYTVGGQLDTSFGAGGVVVVPPGASTSEELNSVAVDTSNRVVVGGARRVTVGSTTTSNFLVMRFTAAGVLDTSFGSGGRVVTSFAGSSSAAARTVAMTSDSKILAVGTGPSNMTVVRLTSTGTFDSTFATAGVLPITFPTFTSSTGWDVVVDPANVSTVVGTASNTGGRAIAIARVASNGTLDTAFDGDGKVTTTFSSIGITSVDRPRIELMNNLFAPTLIASAMGGGGIVAAGYNASGALVPTWGNQGKISGKPPGVSFMILEDMMTVGDGQFLISGRARP